MHCVSSERRPGAQVSLQMLCSSGFSIHCYTWKHVEMESFSLRGDGDALPHSLLEISPSCTIGTKKSYYSYLNCFFFLSWCTAINYLDCMTYVQETQCSDRTIHFKLKQGSPTPGPCTGTRLCSRQALPTEFCLLSPLHWPASSLAPHSVPTIPICGKIVFHETHPWCQKGWRLLN